RRAGVYVLASAFAGSLSACVPSDVQDPYQRTVAGALLGATAGAAIGAAVSLDPGFGAAIGTGAGGLGGGALGLATLGPPPPSPPTETPPPLVFPGFSDPCPPGTQSPALGGSAPPPPARL